MCTYCSTRMACCTVRGRCQDRDTRVCIPHFIAPWVLAASLTFAGPPAHAQVLDTTLWVPNSSVRALVSDANTIYVGGSFTVIGPLTGGGVPLSAASGGAVQPYPRVEGTVITTVSDGAGGWYIGGRITAVGGIPRSNLAHILADGSVAEWNPGPTGTTKPEGLDPEGVVFALAMGGSIVYVCGDFTTISGQARYGLAAVDATTGLATAWSPRPAGWIESIAVSGNTVYVGGDFSGFTIGPTSYRRQHLAALDATTGKLLPFAPSPGGDPRHVWALAVSGNTVYAGGTFNWIGGQPRNCIAALDATTGLATAWNPNADGPVRAIVVSGNTVYAAGGWRLTSIGGAARNRIAALDATTGLATPWNPDADGTVRSLAVSGNTVYAGGYFTHIGGQERRHVAALDAATGAATSWNPLANGYVHCLAASGNAIYAGGEFTSIGGQVRHGLAALDAATGSLTAWNPNAAGGMVTDLAVSGGTVYAGGSFTSIGGQPRSYLAALDAVTGQVTAWGPDALNGGISALAVSGSTVYVGGGFSTIGGQARNRIGALDAVTGAVTPWDPNPNPAGLPAYISTLALDGTTVYVGGQFTTIGGQARNNIAALDATTGAATAWDPNANFAVHALEPTGSTVFAGGFFTTIGGEQRNRIAALDPVTGAATAWNPDASDQIRAIAVRGNTVYAAGQFATMGGQARNHLAALDATTGAPTPWSPGASFPPDALATAEGRVYVGAGFRNIAGRFHPFLAAFIDDTPTPVLVSVAHAEAFADRVELVWEVGGLIGGAVTVYRAESIGAWRAAGTVAPDGVWRVAFTDRDVTPGRRYGYRLGFIERGAEVVAGEAWVDIPPSGALALRGSGSNPSRGLLSASFTLPTLAPATLELLDVTGRRLLTREVGSLGAGNHVVDMTPDRSLAAGVYWLRLTQGGQRLTARAAVVN